MENSNNEGFQFEIEEEWNVTVPIIKNTLCPYLSHLLGYLIGTYSCQHEKNKDMHCKKKQCPIELSKIIINEKMLENVNLIFGRILNLSIEEDDRLFITQHLERIKNQSYGK